MSNFQQPNQYQQYQQYQQTSSSSNTNNVKPASPASLVHSDQSGTSIYLSLLALADQFQRAKQYRLCIHCMESILTLKPQEAQIVVNFHVQLKTRLNLCRLYLRHTLNTNQYVNIHLEKAVLLIKNVKKI